MEHNYYKTSNSYRHFIKCYVAILAAILCGVHGHNNRTHQYRHSGNNLDSLLSNLKHSRKEHEYDSVKCNPCTDDDIRKEAIKMQILQKLGLKSKPRIRLPVPRDVVLETLSRAGGNLLSGKEEAKQAASLGEEEEYFDSEPDDFYGRTSEIITFAEPGKFIS